MKKITVETVRAALEDDCFETERMDFHQNKFASEITVTIRNPAVSENGRLFDCLERRYEKVAKVEFTQDAKNRPCVAIIS